MPEAEPTHDVRRFIAEHISSVAQLELLLLLRTNPTEAWSPDDLARELRVETSWAETELERLAAHGLLERLDNPRATYHFHPRSPELQQAVTAVARAYLLHRVTIIEIIYSKPPGSISEFANAFRLKKDKPHG